MTHGKIVSSCIVKQTDPRMPWAVRRYGCRAMCLIAIPQYVMGECLGLQEVMSIINRGLATPKVIVNDKIRCGASEHLLINWAFDLLRSDRRGRQVGWLPEHKDTVDWEYMIRHWRTDGLDGHFTLHDRNGNPVYDPHEPQLPLYEVARELYYHTWRANG